MTAGRARCIVVGTGTMTAIGKIHGAMTEAVRPATIAVLSNHLRCVPGHQHSLLLGQCICLPVASFLYCCQLQGTHLAACKLLAVVPWLMQSHLWGCLQMKDHFSAADGGDDAAPAEAGRLRHLPVQGHRRHLRPGLGHQHPALQRPPARRLVQGERTLWPCIYRARSAVSCFSI